MHLFNSLSRSVEVLTPMHGKAVSLYTCGPTVYDFAHIGNLRTYIFEDVLKRALRGEGYSVQHVMNITDVGHLTDDANDGQDKMEKGAEREHKTVWDVAAFYTDAFLRDIHTLNILPADHMPRATAYIAEQIAMIQELERKGHTYTTSDGVYFDTSTCPQYGAMARLDIAGLREGARVAAYTDKRNPTDFALWKFSPQHSTRAMEWDAPWGKGFPGWHIECSAMARALLGEQIDIHCGGVDHMPVHHTNEIAQSECATGKIPFAQFWLHGEFLLVNEGRMGKSVGNFITLTELREKHFSPLAYRYLVLTAHYRSKLNFSWESMGSAERSYAHLLERALACGEPTTVDVQYMKSFNDAIGNDLNTPQAMAILADMLGSTLSDGAKCATLYAMDSVLGLDIEATVQQMKAERAEMAAQYAPRIQALQQARAAKQWDVADAIKKEIKDAGFDVEIEHDGHVTLKAR